MSAPPGWSPALKWLGIGADFMEREARFLIRRIREPGARGKLVERWRLHVRLSVPEGETHDGPWQWHDGPVYTGKTKRDCQYVSEEREFTIYVKAVRETTPPSRHAHTGQVEGAEDAAAHTCIWCGVRFKRSERWRFGDLCGSHCATIMQEVPDEVMT